MERWIHIRVSRIFCVFIRQGDYFLKDAPHRPPYGKKLTDAFWDVYRFNELVLLAMLSMFK
jgi:hypothetical protein